MTRFKNKKLSDTDSEKNLNKNSLAVKIKGSDHVFFYKSDFLVYLILAAFIALLFLFIILPTIGQSKGFTVSRGKDTILTYTHGEINPITVNPDYENIVEISKTDKGYSVKIYLSTEKVGFNTVFFDTVLRTAKVTDSNCSERKDCYHSPAISNTGSIYCNPHGLLIKPIGSTADTPITG